MSSQPGERICILCKKSCEGEQRVKDRKGRYMHTGCFARAKAKLAQRQASGAAAASPKTASAATGTARPNSAARAARPRAAVATATPVASALDGLGELGLVESRSAAVAQPRGVCPSCAASMPQGGVVCMTCGFNVTTGEFVTVNKAVSFSADKPKRRTSMSFSNAGALAGNPLIVWGGLLAFFVLFFFVARSSENVTLLYFSVAGLFGLVIGIWTLLTAFQESAGKGLMVFCIPFYAVYYVYCEAESRHLKGAFGVSVVAQVLSIFLDDSQLV